MFLWTVFLEKILQVGNIFKCISLDIFSSENCLVYRELSDQILMPDMSTEEITNYVVLDDHKNMHIHQLQLVPQFPDHKISLWFGHKHHTQTKEASPLLPSRPSLEIEPEGPAVAR